MSGIKEFEIWLNQRVIDAIKISELTNQDFEKGLLTAYRGVKFKFDELNSTDTGSVT